MRLLTLCLLLILTATQTSDAQQPKKKTTTPKAIPQVKEEIPPPLLVVQDPITRGVQYERFPSNEEKKFFDGLQVVLADVKKATAMRSLELPLNPEKLLRGPVEKKVNQSEVRQRLLLCETGSIKTADQSIILAYSDIKLDNAKNCIIVAGRMVDINEAENCIIIGGAVQAKVIKGSGQPTTVKPAGEGKPTQVTQPSVIIARSWLSATSVTDSIAWTIQAKPRDDETAASLVIDKAVRVSLLTPVLGRELGTQSNCKTFTPPAWPTK